jgi:uncharacterized membrane protein
MLILILGLVLFIGAHLIPTAPGLRAALAARLGENRPKLLVTALSFAGLILIVIGAEGFRGSAADVLLWTPPVWGRHLAFLLMLAAFILVVAAYVPSQLRDATRHPMLTGLILWALAHLLANGDLLAAILFGSFLAFGIIDRISLAQRGVGPKKPAQGFGGDLLAVGLGAALWAATFFWLHGLAGLPLLPR